MCVLCLNSAKLMKKEEPKEAVKEEKSVEVKKETVNVKEPPVLKPETGSISETIEIVIDDIEKMGVPVYEYVSKVIIEGEMGTGETLEAGPGPYEFGFWSDGRVNDPEILKPSSMAVDTKGNIYILDAINNRIQKYDPDGKYIKSIIIEGFSGKRLNAETILTLDSRTMRAAEDPFDPSSIEVKKKFVKVVHDYKYRGINIVIDSEDNLYYYLIRNPWKKEEKGEVWQFRDDVVVKKWEGLPALRSHIGEYYGICLELDDSPYIGAVGAYSYGVNVYDIINKKYYTHTGEFDAQMEEKYEVKKAIKARNIMKPEVKEIQSDNENKKGYSITNGEKKTLLVLKWQDDHYRIATSPTINTNKKEIHIGVAGKGIKGTNYYIFNYEGQLIKIWEEPQFVPRRLQMGTEENGLRVVKYDYEPKRQ